MQQGDAVWPRTGLATRLAVCLGPGKFGLLRPERSAALGGAGWAQPLRVPLSRHSHCGKMIPPSLPGVFWVKLTAFNIIWVQGKCLIQSEAVRGRVLLPSEIRPMNASGHKETLM